MHCPVPVCDRHHLCGAHRAVPSPPPPAEPVTVQRRVSQRGQIVVATQRIRVGMIHVRKVVTVTDDDRSLRVDIDGETVAIVPRTTSREIHRYKAYATRLPRSL
jgi:hypothetical protein